MIYHLSLTEEEIIIRNNRADKKFLGLIKT